jgi:hypothetical protein
MRAALRDLKLEMLTVRYPGNRVYRSADTVEVKPLGEPNRGEMPAGKRS